MVVTWDWPIGVTWDCTWDSNWRNLGSQPGIALANWRNLGFGPINAD